MSANDRPDQPANQCGFCGFRDPVGGVAQRCTRSYICELCAGIPAWLEAPSRDAAQAANYSLNVLRRDVRQALASVACVHRSRQPHHAREAAKLRQQEDKP